jgi:hypothetical protein
MSGFPIPESRQGNGILCLSPELLLEDNWQPFLYASFSL